MDVAYIVEHGINFKMAATGTRPEDLFPGVCSSRVSAGHNIHESHNRYQQGGTMTMAFSQLASYVISSGLDLTGLGWWSWIQVGTGDHWTQIVLTYQSCCLSGCRLIDQNGLMKGKGMVATQHTRYFQKKDNFNKPREVFSTQLIIHLRAWRAADDEIILFIDVNKNVYTGLLAKALRGNGLWMEEQILHLTGKEAPHSHCTGKVAIVGRYATPGIICTNSSYLSPHGAGVGNHQFQLHNFDVHTVLGTDYPNTVHPHGKALLCGVKQTVKRCNKVLRQLLIRHQSFEKLDFLQSNNHLMSAGDFQLLFIKWDKEVTQLMLALKKRCNKFWDKSIEFSLVTGVWIRCLQAYRWVQQFHENKVAHGGNQFQTCRRLDILSLLALTPAQVLLKINERMTRLDDLKKDVPKLWNVHLRECLSLV
jgi:hypothetical protein